MSAARSAVVTPAQCEKISRLEMDMSEAGGANSATPSPVLFRTDHADCLAALLAFVLLVSPGKGITFSAGGSNAPRPVLMRCFLSA